MNAIAPIGHNNPPIAPFEAIKLHIEDLLVEARNWADGVLIESEVQSEEIKRLVGDLRDAETAADFERVKEKAPFDQQIADIQDRYNVYIAPLKNKKPGKIPLAIEALNAARKPYLDKLEAEKRALAEAARKEAEAKAAEAAAALRAAQDSDLEAREAAEALVHSAAVADAAAKRAEADKVSGLRKVFKAFMTDRKAALIYYASTRPDDLTAFLIGLAEADVRAGKRQIPGFDVLEGTKL